MTPHQKAVNEWLTTQALSNNISVLQASFELPDHLNDVMKQLTPKQQDEALIKSLDDVRQIRTLADKERK